MIVAVIAGLGSVGMMLMSGLRPPLFLIVLFVGWVIAPFAALVLALLSSRQWPTKINSALCIVSLAVSLCSLAIYGYVLFQPLASQPAFPYVAVPIGSWVIILVVVPIAAVLSRKGSKAAGKG